MSSLGSDLAYIRKDRGLSFTDVEERTKLNPAIIKSIEDNSIFDEIDKNTTYKRSYVRNYAKAVKIDEDEIIYALDKAEAGEYDGNIRRLAHVEPEEPVEDDSMVHDHSPEFETDEADEKATKSGADKEPAPANKKRSVDWVAVGNKAGDAENSSNAGGWTALLMIVFIVVIGVLGYRYFSGPETDQKIEPTVAQSQPLIPADTLQASLLNQDEETLNFKLPPLPDTLRIAVIAANGKLEPVHVISDLGTERPFWIELHDTMHFSFSDTLYVWAVGGFDRMELMFNGRVLENAYPDYYNSKTGRIILTRQIFKNHPEWRRDFSDLNINQ